MEVQNLFANSRVNITNEGKRNLSAVIGSTEYRDEYVKDLIKVGTTNLPFCQLLQKRTHKKLIQHLPVDLKTN